MQSTYQVVRRQVIKSFRLLALVVAVGFVCPIVPVEAQTPPAVASGETPPPPVPEKKSLFKTIAQGGWVMWPIGLTSVFTVYLVVDMYMRTAQKKLCPDSEISKARHFFQSGDYVACYQTMKSVPCAYNNCVKYALSFVGKGKEQTEEALMLEVERESNRLQNRINYLSVIGVCAPMIGLLGTVVGMMGAFDSLGKGGAAGGGNETSELSHHIGEVLVATASGLFIAIPAFMFFYLLRNHLSAQIHYLEDQVSALFRNMPYDHFHGLEIGEEVTYAAVPNWVEGGVAAEA